MTDLAVYPIGSKVYFIDSNVHGTVSQIIINDKYHIMYLIVVWENETRLEWVVNDYELSEQANKTLTIGFRGGENG